MRLWTLHPRYLDAKGLVALWREALLAQKVLLGETRGYRNHPQLVRFREQPDVVAAIGAYLVPVLTEATARGYRFDGSKSVRPGPAALIQTTDGQLRYEWLHLLAKLEQRDRQRFTTLAVDGEPLPHPLFSIVPGAVAPWEVVTQRK